MPSFGGNERSIKYIKNNFKLNGQGEFSVTQGKWISYHTLVIMNMNGLMDVHMKQQWSLVEY